MNLPPLLYWILGGSFAALSTFCFTHAYNLQNNQTEIKTEVQDHNSSIKESNKIKNGLNNINLTRGQIIEEIEKSPPFQQNEILKHYIGLSIDWNMKLSSVDKASNDNIKVTFGDIGSFDGYGITTCIVKLSDYPELAIMKRDTKIRIEAKIDSIDYPIFRLKDVTLVY